MNTKPIFTFDFDNNQWIAYFWCNNKAYMADVIKPYDRPWMAESCICEINQIDGSIVLDTTVCNYVDNVSKKALQKAIDDFIATLDK